MTPAIAIPRAAATRAFIQVFRAAMCLSSPCRLTPDSRAAGLYPKTGLAVCPLLSEWTPAKIRGSGAENFVSPFSVCSAMPSQEKGPLSAGLIPFEVPPLLLVGGRFRDEPDLSHAASLQDGERVGDRLVPRPLVRTDVDLRLRVLHGLRQHVI